MLGSVVWSLLLRLNVATPIEVLPSDPLERHAEDGRCKSGKESCCSLQCNCSMASAAGFVCKPIEVLRSAFVKLKCHGIGKDRSVKPLLRLLSRQLLGTGS